MDIVGAGLSGLIAAHIWPNARVFEKSVAPMEQHKALLRFRSDVVAQVTGIEFKRVKVRKGIWHNGKFVSPSIMIANLYSLKCLGRIEPERSIWNIDPAERFIAPDNFYDQLIDNCGSRIEWDCDYQFSGGTTISTMPLPVALNKLGREHAFEFNRSSIVVQRYRLPSCEAYQTVYFPTAAHSVYRASITGDILIVEHNGAPRGNWELEVNCAFCVYVQDAEPLSEVEQKYGKIVPIEDGGRKRLLFDLTHQHNIYSLGRFAIWKNILLDDVVSDASVIKRLMRGHVYDAYKELRK